MTLRVLYFGSYDRGVGRNAILQDGLRHSGVEVLECHVPLWRDTNDKLKAVQSAVGPVRTVARLLSTWSQLARAHRQIDDYDVMMVGPTAHLDLPLARALSRRRGRPLVFDPLVSITETVRDRELVAPGSWLLATISRLENALFRLPDLVLADTRAHAEGLAREAGLDLTRTEIIPAGAPSVYRELATPYRPSPPGEPLQVLYFGQYIPLHGLETVLHAASGLEGEEILFELLGLGQTLPKMKALAQELQLTNVNFVEDWLPADHLATEHIAHADVCLGAFGSQPKAQRVVPYKVYTAMASGRPVLTSATPAISEFFDPDTELLTVPPSDPAALRAALLKLAVDPDLRQRLAQAGQRAYDARFSPQVLGRQLAGVLRQRSGKAISDG